MLVGHSCGVTLVFQTVMGKFANIEAAYIVKPMAVVGIAGVYELRLLRDDHKHDPLYQDFIEGAFGPIESLWDEVSPGRMHDSGGIEKGWVDGRLAVLALSRNDGVINTRQALAMERTLHRWEQDGNKEQRQVVLLEDLQDQHDEIWSKGKEVASVRIAAIQQLVAMDNFPQD